MNLTTGARDDEIKLKQYQQKKKIVFSLYLLVPIINDQKNLKEPTACQYFSLSHCKRNSFAGETPRANTQRNNELTPEKSIGLQFSLTHNVSENFAMSFNGYHYKFDDYIERYTQNIVRRYRNNQQVTLKGLELTSHWQINQQWQPTFAFQWQQGQDDDNNIIDDGIPSAFKWSLNWQNDSVSIRQQLSYQFSQQHVGKSEIARESDFI